MRQKQRETGTCSRCCSPAGLPPCLVQKEPRRIHLSTTQNYRMLIFGSYIWLAFQMGGSFCRGKGRRSELSHESHSLRQLYSSGASVVSKRMIFLWWAIGMDILPIWPTCLSRLPSARREWFHPDTKGAELKNSHNYSKLFRRDRINE